MEIAALRYSASFPVMREICFWPLGKSRFLTNVRNDNVCSVHDNVWSVLRFVVSPPDVVPFDGMVFAWSPASN